MRVAGKRELLFRRYLPSPFAIALLLTAFAIGLAFWYQAPQSGEEVLTLLEKWYEGLWQSSLLVFMLQMILILVLGHTLALSPVVNAFIDQLLNVTRTAARATAAVCFFTLLVALFNWGLGLIFGAVMARKTAEKLQREGQAFSYALLGAAGYSGLMVWHGGLSGSAPLKAAEKGHLPDLAGADLSVALLDQIPTRLSLDETILGAMNRNVTWVLLIVLPLLAYFLARKKHQPASLPTAQNPFGQKDQPGKSTARGAEKLDQNPWLGLGVGAAMLLLAVALFFGQGTEIIGPNYINFCLFGLGLAFHGSLRSFAAGVEEAVKGAAGILTQFPLYFGIMGLLSSTGIMGALSTFFVQQSTVSTFPLYTFLSAGIINIFVPSGGGQWAIQGPVLIQASLELGVPLSKTIMAMAYGDQLTNMLQPFWALPLLGITGLEARKLIPYTLLFMLCGTVVFVGALLLF